MYIVHSVLEKDIDLALEYYGHSSLEKSGYIHCSDIDTYELVAPNFKDEDEERILLVIDKDKWTAKSIRAVAQRCAQDSSYHLALSNPCFELWLILHIIDASLESDEEKVKMLKNRKEKKNDKCLLPILPKLE